MTPPYLVQFSTRTPLFISLISRVQALPVHSSVAHDATASLAIFLVLVPLFLLGFVVKQVFRRTRRTYTNASTSSVDSPLLPLSPHPIYGRHWAALNSGLLVGFLGSPYWETRLACRRQERMRKRTFPCSLISDKSRQSGSASSPNSSANTPQKFLKSLDLQYDRSNEIESTSSDTPIKTLPAYPRKAYPRNLRSGSSPYQTHRQRVRFERPRNSTFPLPKKSDWLDSIRKSSLRLVKSPATPEIPLPLFEEYDAFAAVTPQKSATPPSIEKTSPDLATATCNRSPHPQGQDSSWLDPPEAVLFMPSPYIRQQPSRLESIFEEGSVVFDDIPTFDVSNTSSGGALSISPLRRPYKSLSTVLKLKLPKDMAAARLSPPLSSFPQPPSGIAVPLEVNPMRATQRNRRSPPIGPSPLRKLILPKVPSSPSRPSLCINGVNAAEKRETYMGITREPFGADLRFDSDSDPNGVLDIIRELVEETNEWDSSLFVNENFKTMIQQSKVNLGPLDTVATSISQPNVGVDASPSQDIATMRSIQSSSGLFPFYGNVSWTDSIHPGSNEVGLAW